jgi:hypothetical protein
MMVGAEPVDAALVDVLAAARAINAGLLSALRELGVARRLTENIRPSLGTGARHKAFAEKQQAIGNL